MSKSSQTLESMSQATWYNRWTQNQFSQYLSGEILEVGCGIGNFSSFLSKYGNLTSIDINRDYLRQAKKKLNQEVDVGFGDIEKGQYFFKEKEFNTIVCMNVLEHIKDDLKALKNIYDLLTIGGCLILLVPAHQFLFNKIDQSIGHFRRYQKEKLKLLLTEDLEIVKIKEINFLGSLGWFLAGKLFKEQKVSEGKIKLFNLISPPLLLLENIFEPPFGTSILVIARKKS